MARYSYIILDRDCAFDVNSLNELLTQGKLILEKAIAISEKIENSAQKVKEIQKEIKSEYRSVPLTANIANIPKIKKERYEDVIDRMSTVLNKLIEEMPACDDSLAKEMGNIQDVLHSMESRVSELKELLDTEDVNGGYTEFRQRLTEIKADWDIAAENLPKRLKEIENNMLGNPEAVQYSDDPVNLSTGNFIYDHEDMKIGGEIPLSFHRYYNSKDRSKGSLGRCFLHNYDSRLEENAEEGKATVSMKDGQKKTFRKLEDGTYRSPYSAAETLTKEKEGTWALANLSGERTLYNVSGQMTRQENRYGRGITFSYDEAGRLEKAETDNYTYLTYSYDEEGMLACVTDHTGRKVELSYAKGKLAAVKVPSGSIYTYRYAKNGRLEDVVNSRGYTAVKNTYDEKRRVTRQEFPDGGHMEFAYDDKKRQVVLTERNGSKTTYVHDSKYRNTDILYEDGTKEHFGYNGKNQRILHTDRNGNTTRMAYDNRGNLTQVVNAAGTKLCITYDALNKPLNIKIDGKEKQKNCYDGKGNLLESRDALGRKTGFRYNEAGLPEIIFQPDGSAVHIRYDENGNIAEVKDASGGRTGYAYDGLNRVIRVTDPNGNQMAFTYDAADNILSLTNAAGDVRGFLYNESGKVTEIRDFDGSVIKRNYNALNRPEEVTDQLGRVTKITYDSMWNPACVTLQDGTQTHYHYDRNNRLTGIEDAAGNIVSYTYDGNGNRTGEKNPLGNTTRFTYDALGHLIHVKGEEGAEMFYAYDAEGHVTEAEDALGNKVFLEYDEAGQLVKERSTMGNSREYTYTALGKPESVTDEAGRKTSYTYLPGGLLSGINHSDGTKESYTYDAAGNVKTHTDRNGFRVIYGYDCLGRVTSIEGNGGEKKEYTYDAVGNVTKVTDVYGHATHYEHSLTGQLIKVTDALGNETEYRYDVCDRLVEIRQYGEEADGAASGPDGDVARAKEQNRANRTCHVTRYQRNLLGQVEAVTDALGNTERYTYDAMGQLIEKLDKEGYLTKYGYTAQGDVNRIVYADGREVKLSYNPLRQLEEMKDWFGITKIENDAMGRALRVQYPDGKEVSYSYGKSGERTGLVYPDGRKVTYSYDGELRLSGLEDGNGTITYGYDEAGRLARKTFPGGMETSYAYDMAGRLSELTHRDREGILDRYSYQYDLIGNKTAIEKQRRGLNEESGLYTYGYDALGRLNAVAKNGGTLREYEYDAFGNRSLLREGGRETAYIYNALNQLVSRADAVDEETYAYDKRGNLSLIMENGALKNRYTYGILNRLERAVNGKGEAASYQYNGLGYRTGKRVRESEPAPERQIQYTIDLTRQYYNLLRKEEAGTAQTYLWDGNVAGMADSTEHRYYLQDDLGSPVRLLNGSGELTDSYGYDEFGQDLYGNQGAVQPFGYTGYQHDGIAGTYFAQAREYKSELGRFAGRDIIKGFMTAPYTLNEYVYCWNNSEKCVDPDGAWPKWKDVDKVVQTVKTIGQYGRGTYTVGLDLSGTPGIWQFDGTIGISIDTKGNIALQGAAIGGVTAGTGAVGVVKYQTLTSASTVYDLEGAGTQVGASGLIPIPGAPVMAMVGGEFNFIGDISKKGPYEIGATFSEGIGIGKGGEVHVQWGETKTLYSINVFDIWDGFYKKMLKSEQNSNKEEKE